MKHKVHVVHFGSEDARRWVDDHLTGMLNRMNVEEEYAIAGRFWLSEITRIVKRGYKVIIIISKDIVTASHSEVMLNHIILKQNSREPCLIPIMLNCTLANLDEDLSSLLQPYVILHHNEANLDKRLKQAICDKCDQNVTHPSIASVGTVSTAIWTKCNVIGAINLHNNVS